MSARRTGIDDYRTVLDPGRVRRRLLTRAAVAAGVMLLMLAGLVFFGGDEGDESEPPTPAAAPGLATAPPAAPLAPAASETDVVTVDETRSVLAEAAMADQALAAPAEAGMVAPTAGFESAPAPIAAAEPAAPADVAAAAVSGPGARMLAPTAPAPARATTVDRNPAGPAADRSRSGSNAAAATGAATTGFTAHLGEYGALDKAERLREALAEQGLPAAIVRRVVIGPAETRKAAERIVARLRQDDKVTGFIVPAAGGKGFLVQAGVFAEPANAEALRRRLSTPARKATIQGRVMLGPYERREDAEAALARVRSERKLAGTVVAAAR